MPHDRLTADHSADGDLEAEPAALQFPEFMGQVGAMLMGRTTYDVVEQMGEWPYGDTPVLVATRRDLEPVADTVHALKSSVLHASAASS